MSVSTNLVESDRQSAVELLDRLDHLAQSVDGCAVTVDDVFQQAIETVQQTCGFTPSIRWVRSETEPTAITADNETSTIAEPAASAAGSQSGPNSKALALARFPLTESEWIALNHPDANPSPDASWQTPFLSSVVECCGVAFLKHQYARTSSSEAKSNSKSNWFSVRRISIALATTVLLLVVPVPFRLPTEGAIQPAVSVGVFAPMAGELTEIAVRDGMKVETGDVLARIESPEIRLQAERLRGELLAAETDLISTRMNASDGTSRREGNRRTNQQVSAKVAVLRTRIESLRKQVALIDDIENSLVIRAESSGQVVMNDNQAESLGQAVLQSQQLMTLADHSRGHRAVVQLPAKAFGYLDAAQSASLRLRSDPSRRFVGKAGGISNTVQIDQRGESVIEMTIELDPSSAESAQDVRFDSPVIGHVWLGYRSLGFVVFRPIIEFIRETSW